MMDKGLLGGAVPAAILVGSPSPSMGYTALPSQTNAGLKLQVYPPYLQVGRGKAVEDFLPVITCKILSGNTSPITSLSISVEQRKIHCWTTRIL